MVRYHQNTMKNLVIAASVVFILAGCAPSTDVDGWNVYENSGQTFNVSISYPPDWTVESESLPYGFEVNIYSPGHSPDALEIDVPALRIRMPGGGYGTAHGNNAIIDGHQAIDSGWTADEFSGTTDGFRSIFINRDAAAIVMFGDSTFHPTFEKMLKSFHITIQGG